MGIKKSDSRKALDVDIAKSSDIAKSPLSRSVVRESKSVGRREKERAILFKLVEYYIKTGRPVGSHTLQEETSLEMSSATIRNYFVSLEEEGYLKQQHTSGGRIPLAKAYHAYARFCLDEIQEKEPVVHSNWFHGEIDSIEPTELVSSIQKIATKVAEKSGLACVMSAPRFDQDSVVNVKYIHIDASRILAVVITEFGLIHTSVLSIDGMNASIVKKAERFSHMHRFKETIEEDLFEESELPILRKIYQETMASYFIMYSSMSHEDLFKAGFSCLFSYPEFQEGALLRPALSLFENSAMLRGLLRESVRNEGLRFWIGSDLEPYCASAPVELSLISVPYYIGGKAAGALALMGPMRILYKEVFTRLQEAAMSLSSLLSKALIKHRITFRMAESTNMVVQPQEVFKLEFCKKDS